MYGLQAVSHVRQRTSHDDRHGVVDVGILHLPFQGGIDDLSFFPFDIHSVSLRKRQRFVRCKLNNCISYYSTKTLSQPFESVLWDPFEKLNKSRIHA